MLEPSEILFVGLGKSAVLWYRCALPATHIGADWCGVRGDPPGVQVMTGLVKGDTQLPIYNDYKVVVMQQPHGRQWLKQIHALHDRGIKVLYEVDDYLHGVSKQTHHDFAKYYTKKALLNWEMCMRACDGIICSTDYIARRYAKFNRKIYVSRNGIDLARYNLTRPERKTTNIGWAGATGHIESLLDWLNEILPVMREHENTCLITIGQPGIAQALQEMLGESRALGIPFAPMECYPAAMCMFDIALAPSGHTSWYRGKSDLRWLEASALAVPTIADPTVYPEIEDGVTGLHASTAREAADLVRALVEAPELGVEIGAAAKDYVTEHRSSQDAAVDLLEICRAVAGNYESMHQLQRR